MTIFGPDQNPEWLKTFAQTLGQGSQQALRQMFIPFWWRGQKPQAAVTPPSAPFPQPTSPTIPRLSTGTRVGGGPQEFTFPASPDLPEPPMLPLPPQIGGPGVADYGAVRGAFEKAKPGPIDQTSLDNAIASAIMGGLAEGAGSVDPTSAGSFARALAAAGAGGARGRERGSVRQFEANQDQAGRTSLYHMKEAGLEKDIIDSQQRQRAMNAEIAFKNAKAIYDTNVANAATKYEYDLKKMQINAPQIRHDANGVSIQQTDPVTKQTTVKFYPTKGILEQAEKLKPMFEAFGQGTPEADSAQAAYIAQQYAGNPIAGREVFRQLTVRDVIKKGAGVAVFGDDYIKAAKDAQTELQATGGTTLMAKPELYQQELNARIAARLLANPITQTSTKWLGRARAHSVFGAMMVPDTAEPNLQTTIPQL